MSTVITVGAALEFVQKMYGGQIQVIETQLTVLQAVNRLIVPQNADRVGLIITNDGPLDLPNLGTNPTGLAVITGIYLANSASVSMTVWQDLVLPSLAWYGFQNLGSSTVITTTEVIRTVRTNSLS